MNRREVENFRFEDEIKSWRKTTALVFDEVMRRMLGVGVPLNQMRHIFTSGDNEEFVVVDDVGYHLVSEIDMQSGLFTVTAMPGRFMRSAAGVAWASGKHRLHDAIARKFDDKVENNLLI